MCDTDRSKVGLTNKLTSATQLVGEIREHLHMCGAWWIMKQFKIKSYIVCRPIPVGRRKKTLFYTKPTRELHLLFKNDI